MPLLVFMLINGNTDTEILKIGDASADLLIADIPWSREKIGNDDYYKLFEQFERVLKPDGMCVVIVKTSSSLGTLLQYALSAHKHFNILSNMIFIESQNEFGNILILGKRGINKIFAPVVLAAKPSVNHRLDENIFKFLVANFSKEGDLVIDPFMGWGGSAKVCNELNREYVGIEIDKERFEEAERGLELCHVQS